jgi:hypothetical protein
MPSKRIPIDKKRQIFAELVELQDKGFSPRESKQMLANKYIITLWVIQHIEDEGIDREWPPLGDGDGLAWLRLGRIT